LRGGELVINLIAEPGHCAIVPADLAGANVSRDVAVIALGQDVDHRFVDYVLKSPQAVEWLTVRLLGSVTQKINLSTLRELPVPCPPIEVQRTISGILGALDNKIDLNRRMKETLGAMARAIFKDWFVDFGPTRAKVEDRAPYLAREIWALFSDRLDNEGKPEGWKQTLLREHVSITKGKSYSSSELRESSTALVTLKSFERGGGYRRDGLKAFVGECKPEQIVREGDVVVAQTDVTQAADVIGRPARVIGDPRFDRLVASLDVAIVRPQARTCLDLEFIYELLRSERFTDHTFAHSTGTTVLHLSKDAIPSFDFVLPPPDTVEVFSSTVSPLTKRLIQNEHECSALAAMRDLLLPGLMSGEVRLKEAERIAETAL